MKRINHLEQATKNRTDIARIKKLYDTGAISREQAIAMAQPILDRINAQIIEKNIQQIISNTTTKEMLSDYEREETDRRMGLADIAGTTDDAEELMEFGLSKLTNLSHTFETIDDINVRMRFQKWLFPAGLTYDGQKFGTSALPLIYRVKQNTLVGVLPDNSHLVTSRRITCSASCACAWHLSSNSPLALLALSEFASRRRRHQRKHPTFQWGAFFGDLTENRTPISGMRTRFPNR